MKSEIKCIDGFYALEPCAELLRLLFDKQGLWENRANEARTPLYRNGRWYTLGASVYMDLPASELIGAFVQKTLYFNWILRDSFKSFYREFLEKFQADFLHDGLQAKYLSDEYALAPLPGFHIFPPEETLTAPFGKLHRDLQWESLVQLPDFPFDKADLYDRHFTFTLPLALPYQGGGMLIPLDETEKAFENYFYEEGNLYVHSGQFQHQVLPFKGPITPLDWRITFQGHGFTHNETVYLYW